MIAAADNLDVPAHKSVKKGLKNVPGHCADLVPNDDSWDELLAHPFWRPVVFATPPKQAVVRLRFRPPGPHLFGETVGRDRHEGFSHPEEIYRSCGFSAASTAVEIAQLVPCQWIIITRRCRLDPLFGLFDVLRLRLILGSFVGRIQPFALVPPLRWFYWFYWFVVLNRPCSK